MATPSWARSLAGEFLGSAMLATVVVGSGIAASTLSPGDEGLQLFQNAISTALGLFVLIVLLAPVSGAHFNPAVSLVDAILTGRPWREVCGYVPVQILGCIAGAVLANAMFAVPTSWSTTDRLTGPHLLAEVVATAGLILVIFGLSRSGRAAWIPAAVGAYIGAAYYFTSSTSFANPAITVGRMVSDTFAGIAPSSAPGFVLAQLLGAGLGLVIVRFLFPVAAAEQRARSHPSGRPGPPLEKTLPTVASGS